MVIPPPDYNRKNQHGNIGFSYRAVRL